TFCSAASNYNTWFVNPSVMSEVDNVEGYFAIKLQSVSWDINGEKIEDYRQKAGQFIRYNPNVPAIRHNAAGKLFLGQYAFDPATESETYTEGIAFSSRPIALNGTYCFTPCSNDLFDKGTISIEILGNLNGAEISLARNQILLSPALTYTAFSIPLTYEYFGVKATKIKIMLSSSQHNGSIEYETANIKTTPDPVTATATGGVLRVQDITLSYI
ncbi:MAG: PCMD domain-containing protein, partial [Paramuribaculum sp.]|nr:PCMD domain-containing protein [Paramuribaculum sp.]